VAATSTVLPPRRRRGHVAQRLERVLRLGLLHQAEDRVEHDDEEDGDRVAEAPEEADPGLGREDRQRGGDHRGADQGENGEVGDLRDQAREQRRRLGLGQAVLAEPLEAAHHLVGLEAGLQGARPVLRHRVGLGGVEGAPPLVVRQRGHRGRGELSGGPRDGDRVGAGEGPGQRRVFGFAGGHARVLFSTAVIR
jgi:GNAT superfamily N-acetyltransferase